MAIGDLNNIFGDAQEEEEKKKSPSNSSQSRTVTADPLSDIFANALKPTPKQVQVETAAKPKEEKSFLGKVFDKAANVAVKVASSVGNWISENQRKNDEASLPMRELMYGKGTLVKDPVTGKNTYSTPRLEAFKAAKTPEERAKVIDEANQDVPLIKFLNSETGKKVTGQIYEKTSNIPLKVIARVKSLGDDTYDEAFAALQAKAKDPNNSRFEKIMYGLQDSGIQSAIGALLSVGVSYASRNPNAGRAVSLAYFAPISAESQRREKGQVESLGNIAIDTVGDTIISGFAESALKSVIKEGGEASLKEFAKQMGKGFLVEGTTEPTQTVVKYANDYKNANTEAERQAVVAKFSEYVKSGGMVDEFLIGGLSGAGITAVAVGGGKALGGKIEVDPSLQSEEGGGTPPPPNGGTGAGKVTAELSVNFSDVRDEAGQLETEVRTDPNNDELARRLNVVQEQLNDYQQAVKTRPVYISEETQDAPLATIETVQYPDGKFSYRFTADTESNSVQSPFINTETYATQKQAVEAGKKEILAWVKTRLANADSVELAKLQEIQAELKKPTKPSTVKVSQETEAEKSTIEPKNEDKTVVVQQSTQVSKGVEKTRTGVYRTTQYTQKGEAQGKAEVRFTRSKKTGKLYMEVKNKAGERIERLSLVQAKKKYGTTNRVEMVERAVNGKKDAETGRWVLKQSNAPVIQNKTQNAAEKKPVKTKGEVKQSRAFKRVQERLGEFADFDVNYNRLNIAKDTANALEFIEKYPIEAKKIALGLMGAPEGITETAISIALAEQADEKGDHALQAQLERSRSLRQTRRGQEIVSERGRFNENSPHFFMQQVLAARLENAGKTRFKFLSKKRGEKSASGAEAKMKEGAEAIKATVKKKLSAADMAQSVIDKLTC